MRTVKRRKDFTKSKIENSTDTDVIVGLVLVF